MGDEKAGRPSLRTEVKKDLDHLNGKVDDVRKKVEGLPLLKWLISGVLLAVIAGAVVNFVNVGG